jgi:thymidylate kinase
MIIPSMLLIIDGPDGAGKTTFARGFGGRYHHEGPPPTDLGPGNLLGYYLDIVRRAATSGRFGTVVFDRLAFSELVYGPVVRNVTRLDLSDYAAFIQETKRWGAAHVLCLPPLETCRANWSAKLLQGKEYVTNVNVFERVYGTFNAYKETQDLVYDYTRGSL